MAIYDFCKKISYKYFSGNKIFIWCIFLVIIALTFYPFFQLGLTGGDDFLYYTATRTGSVMGWGKFIANKGRFYLFFTFPFYSIPYLIDNFYYTKIIQYSTILLCFIIFACLIKKIFKENAIVAIIFLMLIIFSIITYFEPILYVAYPFYFYFSFSFFLLSLLCLLKYTETIRYKYLIHSVCLFSIALLFYETYLLFLLFILAFLFFKNFAKNKFKVFKTKLFYKEFLPFIIVAFVYVLVYFGFNKFFASGDIYPGSTISDDFSLKNFFTIIFGYNSFIFPKHVLNVYGDWLYNIYATIPTLHQSGFLYILRNSEITTLVNAFLQCFLFVYFFNKLKSDISWKKIIITIVVSFLFAISAHSLHACASGYNSNIWMTQQIGYITSSFSYFALVTIFFFVVYAFNKLCYNKKILRYCVLTISTILLFANTIYIGYNNDKFFRYWHKNSHDQVAVIDKFCENDFLSDVSKDALLYMNDESGDSKFMHDLRLYLNYKMSRENTFAKFNLELLKEAISLDTTKDIYLLSSFVQRKSLNNDVLYTLSKVNNNSININVTDEDIFSSGTTNNVKVLFYSPYKDFNFNFYIENPNNDTNLPTYKVNDEIKTGNFGYNQIRILNNNNIGDGSTIFNLSSQYNIKVENFSISNMGSMNNDNSYVIQIEN